MQVAIDNTDLERKKNNMLLSLPGIKLSEITGKHFEIQNWSLGRTTKPLMTAY